MAPPQKGGLEIEMTHSVKYEYLKYGNWDRNLGSSGNLDFCTFHNLTSFSPARAFQYQLLKKWQFSQICLKSKKSKYNFRSWKKNQGATNLVQLCLSSSSPANMVDIWLTLKRGKLYQVFPTLLLQNFKLFTRLALKLPARCHRQYFPPCSGDHLFPKATCCLLAMWRETAPILMFLNTEIAWLWPSSNGFGFSDWFQYRRLQRQQSSTLVNNAPLQLRILNRNNPHSGAQSCKQCLCSGDPVITHRP